VTTSSANFFKYNSIGQFHNVVKEIREYYDGKPLPVVSFKGTVKAHGTNAAVVYTPATNEVTFQSRERVLSLVADNAGFMLYMSQHKDWLRQFCLDTLSIGTPDSYVVYGEWCGGNIQANVAINGLPKMFLIFGVKTVSLGVDTWIEHYADDPSKNIYHISRFGTFMQVIDFNNPDDSTDNLRAITDDVEARCPIGAYFDKEGIGEGVVWTSVGAEHFHQFKVKGEKHSASKVRVLAAADPDNMKAKEFVESVVTEQRLEQGLQWLLNEQLKPFDMPSIGDFLRWVYGDVIKEESDTIVASQLDPKKLGGPIALKAKQWYISKLNNQG